MGKTFCLIIMVLSLASEVFCQTAKEYIESGNAKEKLKDYIGAISDFSKAIEINPNYGLAYFSRGDAKSWLQDYRGAIADVTKAIEIDPKYETAYLLEDMQRVILKTTKGQFKTIRS